MQANLIFENVRAYNVVRFDAKLGQEFKIELVDMDRTIRWFSDNDQVLSIAVEDGGAKASLTALAKGNCDIQLQSNGEIIMTLEAEVFDDIAVTLNAEAKTPILK